MVTIEKHARCGFHFHEDCVILFMRLTDDLDFFQRIISKKEARRRVNSCKNKNQTLEMSPLIRTFATQVISYIKDRTLCRNIFGLKMRELAALLQACYPEEQLAEFLIPSLQSGLSFRERVLAAADHQSTIDSLAESLCMSRSTFQRNFRNAFKESPGLWLRKLRIKEIHTLLTSTDMPYTEIATKLSFCSQSQLSAFCKKHMGGTPTRIRAKEAGPDRL